jgi:hypothetical protein
MARPVLSELVTPYLRDSVNRELILRTSNRIVPVLAPSILTMQPAPD